MKKEELEKIGLTCISVGAIGCALYWWYRYNKAVTEGAVWIMQAIDKMEEQRKIIEKLTKEAAL